MAHGTFRVAMDDKGPSLTTRRRWPGWVCAWGILLVGFHALAATPPKVLVLHSSAEHYELADRVESGLESAALTLPGTMRQSKVLEVQGLTPALLGSPLNCVLAGNAAQADAVLVLLPVALPETATPNAPLLIGVRCYDANSGICLLEEHVEWNHADTDGAVERVFGLLAPVWRQLPLPRKALTPITLAAVNRIQLGTEYQWLCDALQNLFLAEMKLLPGVVLLTQDDVERASRIKQQQVQKQHAAVWNAVDELAVVSFYLQPGIGTALELRVRTRRDGKADVWGGNVQFALDQWSPAFARVLEETQKELTRQSRIEPDRQEMSQLARHYAEQGALLSRFGLFRESLPALATSWVLEPENVRATYSVLAADMNCLFQGNSPWADVQRAQWVSLFIRQCTRLGDSGGLRDLALLLQPGKNDESYFLDGYFTSFLSVTPAAVRDWNRESRKQWGGVIRGVWDFQYGADYDQGAARLRAVALGMSDDSASAVARLKALIRQTCLPPEEGGLLAEPERRYYFCQQWLLVNPFGQMFHLYDEERSFQRYWISLLQELASHPDPTLRVTACIALGSLPGAVFRRPSDGRYESWLPERMQFDADGYSQRALTGFIQELRTPDEPYSDALKREFRKQLLLCLKSAWLAKHKDKLLTAVEEICRPLLERRDVKNLALWEPWRRIQAKDFSVSTDSQDREYARRYEQLMHDILTLVEGTDVPEGGQLASGAKSALDEFKDRFRSYDRYANSRTCGMDILVSRRDWVPAWDIGAVTVASRSLMADTLLWVAFLRRAPEREGRIGETQVAVAGIDFAEGNPRFLLLGQFPLVTGTAELPEGSPLGLAATTDGVFVSSPELGIVSFPLSKGPGKPFAAGKCLRRPTAEDGAGKIVGVAGDKIGRLWGALEDGASTAVGRIDPVSGRWQEAFRFSDLLTSGSSVRLADMVSIGNVLFAVVRVADAAAARWEVWRWTEGKQDARLLSVFPDAPGVNWQLEAGRLAVILKAATAMIELFPTRETATVLLGDDEKQLSALPPGLPRGYSLGASFARMYPWGRGTNSAIDLRTAALENRERFWGVLRDGRIIAAATGAEAADAVLFPGPSLEGQQIRHFGLSPAGVVAIADGTIAIPALVRE